MSFLINISCCFPEITADARLGGGGFKINVPLFWESNFSPQIVFSP